MSEIDYLRRKKENHEGDFINHEIAHNYYLRAKEISSGNWLEDKKQIRILRYELQNKYGLLEVEALNLLRGNYQDIVNKYYRIENLIPLNQSSATAFATWLENELKIQDMLLSEDPSFIEEEKRRERL